MNKGLKKRKAYFQCAFTLIELVMVVLLLCILASLATQKFGGLRRRAELTVAESDMMTIRDAFRNPDGYLDNLGSIPGFSCGLLRMGNLLVATNIYGANGERADQSPSSAGFAKAEIFTTWDPDLNRGWNGPYVRSDSASGSHAGFPSRNNRRFVDDATFEERGFFPSLSGLRFSPSFLNALSDNSIYGFIGEPALFDPWGNPYVLQIPPPQAFAQVDRAVDEVRFRYARIVSAGPDGVLATPCFFENPTNSNFSAWGEVKKSLSRLAGRDKNGTTQRGDDLVLFLGRPDIYEESPQ